MIDLKQRIIKLFIFLAIVSLLWVAGLIFFISNITQGGDIPSDIDVVSVLTGDIDRLADGFQVYKKSGARWLLISGVGDGVSKADFKKYLIKYHINPDNIILGKTATNTIGNAIEVGMFIRINGLKKTLVVTSAYHIPRAKVVFAGENPDSEIYFYPVLSNAQRLGKLRIAMLVTSEYNKTILYIFMHYNKLFAEWVFGKYLSLKYR
jgi:uncharacterized SAM-binding protein YcdF (DUF218 family)